MIFQILIVRVKQVLRELKALGFVRMVFLFGVVVFLLAFLLIHTSKTPNAIYATLAVLILIVFVHSKRGDVLFLKISNSMFKWVLFFEYFFVSICFVLFLLFHGFWQLALITIVAIFGIVQIDFRRNQKTSDNRFLKFIPDKCFEWKGGLRKHFLFIFTIWALGIVLSFFVGSAPIALFLLGIISLSILEVCEPYQMIMVSEKGFKSFLAEKIRCQIAVFLFISTPLLLAYLVFHPRYWYVPVIILGIFCLMQVYAILAKYAFYQPNSKSAAAQIFVGIGVVGFIVPFLLPVVLLLSLRFYFKAKQNLNIYLNDYN